MKRASFFILPVGLTWLVLVSWGNTAREVIALFAEKHISPYDKAWIKELLGNESLGDAATWADRAVHEDAYKHTSSWHFIHLPPGLKNSYELRFVLNARKDKNKEDDIYTASFKQEAILRDSASTKSERAVALKFLISLVEDAHDPSHIIIDDKEFYTERLLPHKTNRYVFSAWNDGRLIGRKGESFVMLADSIDKITPKADKRGDGTTLETGLTEWLWESYELNLKLNSERQQKTLTSEKYYHQHNELINKRLELAGWRLGATLISIHPEPRTGHERMISDTFTFPSSYTAGRKDSIPAIRIGGYASIRRKVYGHKDVGNVVLVYLGAPYPHQLLTLILEGVARSFEVDIDGRTIFISGSVINYKGGPAIEVDEPYMMSVDRIK